MVGLKLSNPREHGGLDPSGYNDRRGGYQQTTHDTEQPAEHLFGRLLSFTDLSPLSSDARGF